MQGGSLPTTPTARADPVADDPAAADGDRGARGRRSPTSTPSASTGQPCETNADQDCGTLTVPIDYADPDGRDDRPGAAAGARHRRRASARWW